MHILIGMAVATLLIIGVAVGNLFACVFLSLLPAAYLALALTVGTTNSEGWAIACFVLLCVIWVPRWLRLRAANRAYVRMLPKPPKSQRAHNAGAAVAAWIRNDLAVPSDESCMKSLALAITVCAVITLAGLPFFPH
jgi:uncharacterized membrane protein